MLKFSKLYEDVDLESASIKKEFFLKDNVNRFSSWSHF